MTTTYELTGCVLKDNQTFTLRKDGCGVARLRWWMPGIFRSLANNMLAVDEPDHTRLRGIVDEAFRRRVILGMEPRILASWPASFLRKEARPISLPDMRESCPSP